MFLKPLKAGNLTLATNILIAPLAGYTNLPTRLLYRKQGAGIAYAEMISAEGLNYSYQKSVKLLDSDQEDRPLGLQIFGARADRILEAFLKLDPTSYDLVDINCGCSVRKIIKSGCGASLLQRPDEIFRIISSLKNHTDKPVTLKIRSGTDYQHLNYLEVLDAAEKAGASLITFHPRTKAMLFTGKADWSHIKIMKSKASIPVIGNGDLFTPDDVVRMFQETGCDGVMLARGVMHNPFLVEEVIAKLKGDNYHSRKLADKMEWIVFHCGKLVEYYGESRGILEFRKFLHGYLKGYPEVKRLRERLNTIHHYNEFIREIENYSTQLNEV